MRTQESQLDDDDVDRKFQEGPVTDWGGGRGEEEGHLPL